MLFEESTRKSTVLGKQLLGKTRGFNHRTSAATHYTRLNYTVWGELLTFRCVLFSFKDVSSTLGKLISKIQMFKTHLYIFLLFTFITSLNIVSVTDPSLEVLALPRIRWSAVEYVTPRPQIPCINKWTLSVCQTKMIYCMHILYWWFMWSIGKLWEKKFNKYFRWEWRVFFFSSPSVFREFS